MGSQSSIFPARLPKCPWGGSAACLRSPYPLQSWPSGKRWKVGSVTWTLPAFSATQVTALLGPQAVQPGGPGPHGAEVPDCALHAPGPLWSVWRRVLRPQSSGFLSTSWEACPASRYPGEVDSWVNSALLSRTGDKWHWESDRTRTSLLPPPTPRSFQMTHRFFFKSESKKSGERVNDKKSWGGNKEAGAKTRLPERLAFDDSFRHKPMKQLHCSWAHCPLF